MELTSNIEGEQLSVNMVKETISHLNLIFMLMIFISAFVESIQKGEFSKKKPQVWTTSKCMQHNVEIFLSSKLGHSPKRNVKLLGREQRSDFHHDQTTLSRHVGLSLVLSVSVSHPEVSIYRKQVSNLSDNVPRALEIMSV